ncbi:hypothetical protein REPUB_Repub11eG0195500 [Reevesia pubescens]
MAISCLRVPRSPWLTKTRSPPPPFKLIPLRILCTAQSSVDDKEQPLPLLLYLSFISLFAIQNELETAIFKAGGIRDSNYGDLHKIAWARSSRTDKGVHSSKMEIPEDAWKKDPNGITLAICVNSYLPDDIKGEHPFHNYTQRSKYRRRIPPRQTARNGRTPIGAKSHDESSTSELEESDVEEDFQD